MCNQIQNASNDYLEHCGGKNIQGVCTRKTDQCSRQLWRALGSDTINCNYLEDTTDAFFSDMLDPNSVEADEAVVKMDEAARASRRQ